MPMTKRKQPKSEQIKITFPNTPAGVLDAYVQLESVKRRMQAEQGSDFRSLLRTVAARSTYTSDDEVFADVEAEREELYRERQQQQP